MIKVLFFVFLLVALSLQKGYEHEPKDPKTTISTSVGTPVDGNQNSITAGPRGPILLQDFHLLDKLAHFDHERIPERVVHARGAGAHGYFEVTNKKIRKYTKAAFLNKKGKRTPLFVRFSTVGGEKGSADSARDPRGFAIKFYTEEGNQDLVGNNTPVFFIRDPIKFPDFIHSQKRNPQTNLPDANMVWDFMSQHPESSQQFTVLFSDAGTPDGFRHMNGFSSHTLKLVNKKGKVYWSKWHFISDAGIKNHTAAEATRISGEDPDYSTRDLFNHIASGKTASWTLYFQIIPYEEGLKYKYNIFDVTKTVDEKDYPLIPVGKMVLNRNPTNFFAEVEQAAFCPSNMVPGIEPSNDKMLQGRLFSYKDTQRHRLGPNNHLIPINKPLHTKFGETYFRDGPMVVDDNGGAAPNYEQNTYGGPTEDPSYAIHGFEVDGKAGRYDPIVNHPTDDYVQTGEMWKSFSETDKKHLIENMAGSLGKARKDIQKKVVDIFYKCNKYYGIRLAKALGFKSYHGYEHEHEHEYGHEHEEPKYGYGHKKAEENKRDEDEEKPQEKPHKKEEKKKVEEDKEDKEEENNKREEEEKPQDKLHMKVEEKKVEEDKEENKTPEEDDKRRGMKI